MKTPPALEEDAEASKSDWPPYPTLRPVGDIMCDARNGGAGFLPAVATEEEEEVEAPIGGARQEEEVENPWELTPEEQAELEEAERAAQLEQQEQQQTQVWVRTTQVLSDDGAKVPSNWLSFIPHLVL